MRSLFPAFLSCVFLMTFSVIGYELFSVYLNKRLLKNKDLNLPTDSYTLKIAQESMEKFLESQKKATSKRRKFLSEDITEQAMFALISVAFVNKFLQKKVLDLSEKRITILEKGYREYKRGEVNTLNLFFSAYLCIYFWFSDWNYSAWSFLKTYMYIFVGYFFIFPFVCMLSLHLLNNFGCRILFACYLAYILKLLPEIFSIDPLDEDSMAKIEVSSFPDDIQDLLYKYDLLDSVYGEKDPSDNMNAALIGYGRRKRMEIYGDIDKLDREKLLSVLLHELGHVYEKSLMKKSIVYFSIVFLEFILFLFLFRTLSPLYSHEKISRPTVFLVMALIYKMCVRQWLFLNYKFVSQHSEMVSDYFTKSNGYGSQLSSTLYTIAIDSSDYIRPSKIYNLLRSGHPSIYERIEYLSRS